MLVTDDDGAVVVVAVGGTLVLESLVGRTGGAATPVVEDGGQLADPQARSVGQPEKCQYIYR